MNNLHTHYLNSAGICTDTRKISKDCLYFALKGENFDGNLFAKEAIEKGAKLAIIDNEECIGDFPYLLVDDVLTTLQKLALYHRSTLSIPFIAIAGSNGKTTTKELVASVLSKKYKTYFTPGNFNNHIGVPLTLLSIPKDTEIAVIEMGANHLNEIEELCKIAKPTHGLITNVGKDHLEGYGSLEAVGRGNAELYTYLKENNGTIFLNTLDSDLLNLVQKYVPKNENVIPYPQINDFIYLELMSADYPVSVVTSKGQTVFSQLFGEYNFYNIATAMCIGIYFDVEMDDAIKGIESYKPQNNRSQVVHKNSNTLILDAYNANPSSMKLAIKSLIESKQSEKPKWFILGDMFELGDFSADEHLEMINWLKEQGVKNVLFCGSFFCEHSCIFENYHFFSSTNLVKEYLQLKPIENAWILLKGSRGMKIETLVDLL